MSLDRRIKRTKEKEEQKKLKKLYNKKPKAKCPKCHKKSLFITNNDNKTFCVLCNEVVKINQN